MVVRANMAASEEDRLPEDELLGQMKYVFLSNLFYRDHLNALVSTLILGGTDTTSNAITVTLEILGRKQDVQDKLRAEIIEGQVQYGEDMPYDQLVGLPYMDAVCRESLRL